ncbi:MAG TPA: hypothetical protein VF158_16040 [Longimicrobiales bacterium]
MGPEFVRRVEEFSAALGREQYRALAGLTAQPALAAVYGRFGDLFRTDTLAALADSERAAVGPARRRLRALREYLITCAAERAAAEVVDRRLAWEAATYLEVDGDRIPLRQAGMALANAAEAGRRRALEAARMRALREAEPLDRDRLEREWDMFRLAGGDFRAAWESLTGIALGPLAEAARALLEETEAIYRDLLTYELPRRLGVSLADAIAADRLRLERAPWLDDRFGGVDPVAVARRQLAEIGWDVEVGGRVALDLEPRPTKWSRAFCAVIRVPDELVLVVSRSGGWRDWYAFFHELGHAQHFARVDPGLPFEDRALGDTSVTEAYARLFDRLPTNPTWLGRYLGLGGGEQAEFVRLAALLDLLRLRRQAGKLLYELELHGAGRFEGMPELYAECMAEATLLPHDPAAYLDDVDPHFYCARYLRAWALSALLAEHLRETFDEDWFRNPRSGPFLEDLFSRGQAEDGDALAKRLGDERLTFARVRVQLEEAIV